MRHKIHVIERVLGITVLVTILLEIKLLSFIFSQQILGITIVLAFFSSALIGAMGMFRGRLYGYIGIYIFIPLSTYGLGISTIPFVVNFIPPELKTSGVIIVNIILLVVTIAIHAYKSLLLTKLIESS